MTRLGSGKGRVGNDTLKCGGGRRTLIGGPGADTFLYSAGAGSDRFTDFSAAQGHKVDRTA
jgi:Ca2+-binding RTX toxin-like protein